MEKYVEEVEQLLDEGMPLDDAVAIVADRNMLFGDEAEILADLLLEGEE